MGSKERLNKLYAIRHYLVSKIWKLLENENTNTKELEKLCKKNIRVNCKIKKLERKFGKSLNEVSNEI